MADPTPSGDAVNALVRRVLLLENRVKTLESPSGTQRAQAVRSIPYVTADSSRQAGFGIGNVYSVYAAVNVTVPDGRNWAQVTATGVAAVTDMMTGGMTTSSAVISIQGRNSGEFPAAKDAAAQRVINVLMGAHTERVPVTPGGAITITLSLKGLNGNAFPANSTNFALIAATVSFTYQEG